MYQNAQMQRSPNFPEAIKFIVLGLSSINIIYSCIKEDCKKGFFTKKVKEKKLNKYCSLSKN
jgi:hypothetical protein